MFAVISDGSRQYRVHPGDTFDVDFRSEAKKGDTIAFDRVLLANGGGGSAIGRPTIEGALVEAKVVVPEAKGKKLEIQKIRRRKNYRRHTGHRQKYTTVRVTAITVPGLKIVDQPDVNEENAPQPARKTPARKAPESPVTADEAIADAPATAANEPPAE